MPDMLNMDSYSGSSEQNPGVASQNFSYNLQNPEIINSVKTTTLTYNTDDFRLNRTYTQGLQDLNYGYDNKGNILSISEAVENYYQSLGYDDLDRLVTASETGRYSQSFGYDSIGNIIRVTDNNNIRDYSYSAHQVTFIENKTFNNSCTGSQPPNFGNWVVASLTTCLLSKIHLSQDSNLTVRNELTLNNSNVTISGKLVLNGKLSLSNSKVIFKTSSSPSGDSLSYDANGNLISGLGYTYEYNDANQLAKVNDSYSAIIAQYWYYPTGERFKKTGFSGVTTYYIGKDYETKVNASGSFDTTYYYANGELLSRKDSNGQRYYYHNDHLTGTNVVTDSAGNLVERTRYYPFGKILEGGTSSRLFTGQKWDNYGGYSGLYYYGARYYNPEIMRFTQADPMIQNFYEPQQLNRYSYVLNNPLKYNDPTGNYAQLVSSVLRYGISAVSDFALYMSESWFAFSVFETTQTAYQEAGLEGVAVNTAEWVLGPKILSSAGGKIASTASRIEFARELSAAVKG